MAAVAPPRPNPPKPSRAEAVARAAQGVLMAGPDDPPTLPASYLPDREGAVPATGNDAAAAFTDAPRLAAPR